MKPLSCKAIRASFSEYLDGAVSGLRMQQIARHIEGYADDGSGARIAGCETCARELAAWRATEDALTSLGPAKAPADLALRLRVAISHEHARRSSRLMDRLSLAWENAVRPMLLQVTGGLVGSVALLGGVALLLSAVAAPTEVLANDEPLGALTAPHFLYSTASPVAIVTENDTVPMSGGRGVVHVRVVSVTSRVTGATLSCGVTPAHRRGAVVVVGASGAWAWTWAWTWAGGSANAVVGNTRTPPMIVISATTSVLIEAASSCRTDYRAKALLYPGVTAMMRRR